MSYWENRSGSPNDSSAFVVGVQYATKEACVNHWTGAGYGADTARCTFVQTQDEPYLVPDGSCESGYQDLNTGACVPGVPALPPGAIDLENIQPGILPPPTQTQATCPRGKTYKVTFKDTILGCDIGYNRPLFGDYCECTEGRNLGIIESTIGKEGTGEMEELGFTQLLKILPTLIIIMAVVSIIGAFRR